MIMKLNPIRPLKPANIRFAIEKGKQVCYVLSLNNRIISTIRDIKLIL